MIARADRGHPSLALLLAETGDNGERTTRLERASVLQEFEFGVDGDVVARVWLERLAAQHGRAQNLPAKLIAQSRYLCDRRRISQLQAPAAVGDLCKIAIQQAAGISRNLNQIQALLNNTCAQHKS